MRFDEYQELARRTSGAGADANCSPMTCALGLVGEVGEVADLLKKHIGHGHPLDRDKLIKELGDCCWYGAETASLLEIQLSDLFLPVDKTTSVREFQNRTFLPGKRLGLGTVALQLAAHASLVAAILTSSSTAEHLAMLTHDLRSYWQRLAELAGLLDLNLDEVLAANIAKLKARYPEGFSSDASINRTEDDEEGTVIEDETDWEDDDWEDEDE